MKISVIVLTYNHEKYIAEALDSVLNQPSLPDEIVVSDDFSTDNTVKILESYKERFPELIKIFVNDSNLGIYAHVEETKFRVTGDVVCYLAGDDFYAPKAIENLRNEIANANLNSDDAFIIVTNLYIYSAPNSIRPFNNYQLKDMRPISLRIRGDLSHRRFGMSRKLLSIVPSFHSMAIKYPHVGYGVDTLNGLEELKAADHIIFANFYSNFYRVGVGVTSQPFAHKSEAALELVEVILSDYKDILEKRDFDYLGFSKALHLFLANRSIGTMLKFLFAFVLNFNNFSPNRGRLFYLRHLIPQGKAYDFVARLYQKMINIRV